MTKAYFHLPGLFEFYELYKRFIPLFFKNKEYFYDFVRIGSIYGSPSNTIFSGGRIEYSDIKEDEVKKFMDEYKIPIRLTFSNSELNKDNLKDKRSNEILKLFEDERNGIIIHSDLLLNYIKENYPKYHFVSSTTKVLTKYEELINELNNKDFKYVVPDFRLNKKLDSLEQNQKDKVEFLLNECCPINCKDRKECYKTVSKQILNEDVPDYICPNIKEEKGYRFSNAKKSSSFISIEDIQNHYLPNGFSNFKIEGRSLGSALVLEFLLYYMVKPEYQINVREEIYLDNNLDLF